MNRRVVATDEAPVTLSRYMLFGQIASGGMATVHVGRLLGATGFSKIVAIKRLHREYASETEFAKMFIDEAKLASRINHPNVVQTLDVLEELGEVLIVMELIRGASLGRIARSLRTTGTMIPVPIVLSIVVGALQGLHAAHEALSESGDPLNIIHRDMSPQNILLSTDGIAKVLDFGIAKASVQLHLTQGGEVKGKLAYMAPEQITGDPSMDRRADIFSMGVVLWQLLTGRKLFESDYTGGIFERSKPIDIPLVSATREDVSPALEAVVRKALSHQKEDRYSTAREFAIALEGSAGIATQSSVAEWLHSVCAAEIKKEDDRIRVLESSARNDAGALPTSSGEIRTVQVSARAPDRAKPAVLKSVRPGPDTTAETSILDRREDERTPGNVPRPLDLPVPSGRREKDASLPSIFSSDKIVAYAATGELRGLANTNEGAAYSNPPPPRPTGVPLPHELLPSEKPKKKRSLGKVFLSVAWKSMFVLVIVAVILFFLSPRILQAAYQDRVRSYGLDLSVRGIDLTLGGYSLREVVVSSKDAPGITLLMPTFELPFVEAWKGELPVLQEAEILLEGSHVDLTKAATTLQNRISRKAPVTLQFKSARFVWGKLVGGSTKLDVSDLDGSFVLGTETSLDRAEWAAKSLRLAAPNVSFGPYAFRGKWAPNDWSASIDLNTSGGAKCVMEEKANTFSIHVHGDRALAPALGVSKKTVGALVDESPELTLDASYVRNEKKIKFAVHTILTGARYKGAGQVKLQFDASGEGDLGNPIETRGIGTYGPFPIRLWGKTVVGSESTRFDWSYRSAPTPCDATEGPALDSIRVADLEAKIRRNPGPGTSSISGVFSADTRTLAELAFTLVPMGKCSPGLPFLP
ncbi:MAG: serine/threonine protein kinase [Polyangiaceae bacterium]|nr:serine/threonine protein kinase [Polyangiaceae bacterium]